MGLNEVLQTGRTGLVASKAAIATTGHNISNANTKGYSRQRVETEAQQPVKFGQHGFLGRGVNVDTVKRINDEFLEKHIRNTGTSLAKAEERDSVMKNVEDIFNEMNGDGLNRVVARFFNQFRQLANDPNSEAIRQSVREATSSLVGDFKRIRGQLVETQNHIDAKVTNFVNEANTLIKDIRDLDQKIKQLSVTGGSPNDLLDQKDLKLKKLGEIVEISTFPDGKGGLTVQIPGIGPLISGPVAESFGVVRSGPDPDSNKRAGSLDVTMSGTSASNITDVLKNGRLGGLVDLRDKSINKMIDRLDDLAFTIHERVNQVHTVGYNRFGETGTGFFKGLAEKDRAAEFLDLTDDIKADSNKIAAAVAKDSPGDNRVAIAISGIQHLRLMSDGKASFDDWYNSIVSDVGVVAASNREIMNQQSHIAGQLSNIRDQVSGVSIDEETANLMQFQHVYDASARVIRVADEMLDTVLKLKPM